MACCRNLIIIIGDSRVALMESSLRYQLKLLEIRNDDCPIKAYSGARIHEAVLRASDLVAAHKDATVYLMAGTNDLTVKHKSGLISPVYQEVGNLVEVMFDKYIEAKVYLSKIASKVVICQLTGVDIDKYNKYATNYSQCQDVINQAIPILNHSINLLNKESQVVSPWLQTSVHCQVKNKIIHKYRRLYDGIHPTPETSIIWAKELAKAIDKNSHWVYTSY